MRVVDTAALAVLRDTGIAVYDGLTLVSTEPGKPMVITYTLPYAVYYSNVGDDHARRLSGFPSRRSVFISLTYVGLTAEQAKAAGERLRDAMQESRLEVPGHNVFLTDVQESQRIRRDDDAIRPDGRPLFYGVDNYAVSVTRTKQEAIA